MFVVRKFRSSVYQKKRTQYLHPIRLVARSSFLNKFDSFVVALRGGFLNSRCVTYFYTHCRKTFRVNKKSTKLWLNLPAANVISKKALNVRMGKGKGARLGVNARVYGGNFLVAILGARGGLVTRVVRFLGARCSFGIRLLLNAELQHPYRNTVQAGGAGVYSLDSNCALNSKSFAIMSKRYAVPQIFELYAMLRRLQRVKLYLYFSRLFKHYRPAFFFFNEVGQHVFYELQAI
jgi:hypothetical protein